MQLIWKYIQSFFQLHRFVKTETSTTSFAKYSALKYLNNWDKLLFFKRGWQLSVQTFSAGQNLTACFFWSVFISLHIGGSIYCYYQCFNMLACIWPNFRLFEPWRVTTLTRICSKPVSLLSAMGKRGNPMPASQLQEMATGTPRATKSKQRNRAKPQQYSLVSQSKCT